MSKWKILASVVALIVMPSNAFADAANDPVRITAEQAAGPAFEGQGVLREGGTSTLQMANSSDRRFVAGLFKSGAGEEAFEAYPNDEFCYFLSGDSTLTSADGTVMKFKAGDSAFIPRGWKGKWATTGFSKFFAIYQPLEKSNPEH